MKRIQQDVGKFTDAVAKVVVAKGIALDEEGHSRDGHRKQRCALSSNRGGLRVKKERKPDKWVHPDAIDGRDKMRAAGQILTSE